LAGDEKKWKKLKRRSPLQSIICRDKTTWRSLRGKGGKLKIGRRTEARATCLAIPSDAEKKEQGSSPAYVKEKTRRPRAASGREGEGRGKETAAGESKPEKSRSIRNLRGLHESRENEKIKEVSRLI